MAKKKNVKDIEVKNDFAVEEAFDAVNDEVVNEDVVNEDVKVEETVVEEPKEDVVEQEVKKTVTFTKIKEMKKREAPTVPLTFDYIWNGQNFD